MVPLAMSGRGSGEEHGATRLAGFHLGGNALGPSALPTIRVGIISAAAKPTCRRGAGRHHAGETEGDFS